MMRWGSLAAAALLLSGAEADGLRGRTAQSSRVMATTARSTLRPLQYYTTVQVGTPLKAFKVLLDTTSSHLVLPAASCDDAPCTSHEVFGVKGSSTASAIGWADEPLKAVKEDDDRDVKALQVGEGEASGVYVRDRLCFDLHATSCAKFNFITLSEEADDPFAGVPWDGILGLRPTPEESEGPEFSLLAKLHGSLASPALDVLTLYLPQDGSNGVLSVGAVPKALGEMVWEDVLAGGKMGWNIALADIQVAGKSVAKCPAGGCVATVDTASSYMLAPSNLVQTLQQALDVAEDCSNMERAPALTLVLASGHKLELPASSLVDMSVKEGKQQCYLGLMPATGALTPTVVLGYPVLRTFATSLDFHQMKVGFSAKASTELAKAGVAKALLEQGGLTVSAVQAE